MGQDIHIDQFCAGFSSGDAISNEALILQDFLRHTGYKSDIYCEQFHESDSNKVKHYREYSDKSGSILIYHHSYSTGFLNQIHSLKARSILIYHNMTPSRFVRPYNIELANQLDLTRDTLSRMSRIFDAILCDSQYNENDLREMGFPPGRVMPVTIPLHNYSDNNSAKERLNFLDDGKTNVLFVGRFFPNKKHQDIIKSFYFFKKRQPHSRLILVGSFHPGVKGYTAELNNLIHELELSDDIFFPGTISDQDLYTYYHKSHIFFSMSEHEGFFVPLVESMYFDLPILAYSSSAIPETMGKSGIQLHEKDFVLAGELLYEISRNLKLSEALVKGQQKRAEEFTIPGSLNIFSETLRSMGIEITKDQEESYYTQFA